MSINEERKTCLDCELYDIMTGNIYGVCLKDSYIDSDEDSYIQWMYSQARACEHFKEVDDAQDDG